MIACDHSQSREGISSPHHISRQRLCPELGVQRIPIELVVCDALQKYICQRPAVVVMTVSLTALWNVFDTY